MAERNANELYRLAETLLEQNRLRLESAEPATSPPPLAPVVEVSSQPHSTPPQRVAGGDPVRILRTSDSVLMMELRPDGTVGEEYRIPLEDFEPRLAEGFRRRMMKKQGRQQLRLVP